MFYSKKSIYLIIENRLLFEHTYKSPDSYSFIAYLDVFHTAYKKLHPTEQKFLNDWSQGLSVSDLSKKYNLRTESIKKRKTRLVKKIYNLLNGVESD